jgi:hypothetical protein
MLRLFEKSMSRKKIGDNRMGDETGSVSFMIFTSHQMFLG